MSTDNRTSEPTLEQVEAAAKAIADCHNPGMFEKYPENWRVEARAALVAAQGAVPQAESAPKSSYISPSLPAMIRNLWKNDPSENSVRTALKLAGDLIQELIDLKAAPVLPSSGVDEDKLAEVIASVTDLWDDPLDEVHDIPQIARAVAEWLHSNPTKSA